MRTKYDYLELKGELLETLRHSPQAMTVSGIARELCITNPLAKKLSYELHEEGKVGIERTDYVILVFLRRREGFR